jgi:hypothetical protein
VSRSSDHRNALCTPPPVPHLPDKLVLIPPSLGLLRREPLIDVDAAGDDPSETQPLTAGEPPLISGQPPAVAEPRPVPVPRPPGETREPLSASLSNSGRRPSLGGSLSGSSRRPSSEPVCDKKGGGPPTPRGSFTGVLETPRGSIIGTLKDEFFSSLSWSAFASFPAAAASPPLPPREDPTSPDLTFKGALTGKDLNWFIFPKQASLYAEGRGYASLCLTPSLPWGQREVFWKVVVSNMPPGPEVLVGISGRCPPLAENPRSDDAVAMFASDGGAYLRGKGVGEGSGPVFGEGSALVFKLERMANVAGTATLSVCVDRSADVVSMEGVALPVANGDWWAVVAARQEGTVLAVEPVLEADRF